MTSVHWYKTTSEKETTPEMLLEEGQIRTEMENLKKIVEVSNRWAASNTADMVGAPQCPPKNISARTNTVRQLYMLLHAGV